MASIKLSKSLASRGLRDIRDTLWRWRIILKLRLARLSGIGMKSRAAHDFVSVVAQVLSLIRILFGGLFRFIFGQVMKLIRRVMVYIDPLADWLHAVFSYLSTSLLRLTPHLNHKRGRLIPAMMLMCVTMMICAVSYLGIALEVTINGQSVGFVQSKSEMENILRGVESTISEYIGAPYNLNLRVSYSLGYMEGSQAVNKDVVNQYVMSQLTDVSKNYAIMVDGKLVGAHPSKTALELLKQRVLQGVSPSVTNGKLEFVQDVQIVEVAVPQGSVLTIGEIEQRLMGNTKESTVYTVQSSDTVSAIAKRFSTTISDIQNLNPGLDIARINIGDKILLSASVPYLSVKLTATENYVQRIGYETTTQKTDSLYTTQSRVVKSGVYGEADVVADVIYVNGVEQSRTVMSWVITKEPSNEIVEVGTQTPPAKSATGSFRRPSNGVFSSGYGYRKNLGDFHTGIDYAGAVGTYIYAADGGTVISSGWKGNYGYCVMIDHGNGYVTLYAHCSSLKVSQGQKVAKGEVIALVGATGRVTGPHLHFEIRYNGQHVNPLNYVSK